MLSQLWSLVLLTRAHFLAGGVIMYAMGAIVACADGASPTLLLLVWGQMGVSAVQLMTHFINEYYDVERDRLVTTRTLFSGGSGVLPADRLEMRVAVWGAVVCAVVGTAVTLTIGWPTALVYAIAIVIGYGYSTPPLRLMTRGLGEFIAGLTVALLTPLAGYGVAAGRLSASVLWLGLPLLATSLAFMITVEIPDYEADHATGKRNWVVRLGRDGAGQVHNGLLILSYLLLALVTVTGFVRQQAGVLLWLTLPLAMWQMGGVWLRIRRGWRHYGVLAAGGMVLVGLYGLLAGLGFLA
jgi:1,4-dihydroxy-2-naphthoate octaprenyltransferase